MAESCLVQSPIPVERVKELLTYNPETGEFIWNANGGRGRQHSGKVAGTKNKGGYIRIRIDGYFFMAHRLAWLVTSGFGWPKEIDHINNQRDDNRIANLRSVTRSQNRMNSRIGKNNVSGHKGVYWHASKGVWAAYVGIDGKQKYIGQSADKATAVKIYEHAAKALHGEFYNPG